MSFGGSSLQPVVGTQMFGMVRIFTYGGVPVGSPSSQGVSFTGAPTGGSFTLSLTNPNTHTAAVTGPIAYNATAATQASNVQTAVQALGGSFATATAAAAAAGVAATNALHATAAITAGTFVVTQGANSTAAIAYNATAAAVTAALAAATPAPIPFAAAGGTFATPTDYTLTANAVGVQGALGIVGTGIVGGTLSVVPGTAGVAASPLTITFTGTNGIVPVGTANSSLLTPAGAAAVTALVAAGMTVPYTGVAGPGMLLTDTINKVLYINTGTFATPVWSGYTNP